MKKGLRLLPQALIMSVFIKAPQDTFNPNRSFTELGSWQIKKLGRRVRLHFFPWGRPNPPESDQSQGGKSSPAPKAPRHDPLALARFYQSLLDSRIVESRAALARHLGVSRARVTQVLRRLKQAPQNRSDRS